jgi:hypothetical protein
MPRSEPPAPREVVIEAPPSDQVVVPAPPTPEVALPKPKVTLPRGLVEAAPLSVVDEFHGQGGSYLLDPATGIRTLVERTKPAPL